jgi:molybdopterin molybdotransferase
MISIQEALQLLEDNLPEPRIDTVDLSEAHGRYLVESVAAPEPSPRYTNSAMDGYAVRWSDVMAASRENPVTLKVAGESKAGMPFAGEVKVREAVHISTGAMIPAGADTVVRVEDTRKPGDESVEILAARAQGQDVRYEGEEFNCGDELLRAGTKLSARQLAILATVGQHQVNVFAPPRVSILITGSELASSESKEIESHQIRDSNSIMLKTVLQEAGATVHSCSNVEDELQTTIDAIDNAVSEGVEFFIC